MNNINIQNFVAGKLLVLCTICICLFGSRCFHFMRKGKRMRKKKKRIEWNTLFKQMTSQYNFASYWWMKGKMSISGYQTGSFNIYPNSRLLLIQLLLCESKVYEYFRHISRGSVERVCKPPKFSSLFSSHLFLYISVNISKISQQI